MIDKTILEAIAIVIGLLVGAMFAGVLVANLQKKKKKPRQPINKEMIMEVIWKILRNQKKKPKIREYFTRKEFFQIVELAEIFKLHIPDMKEIMHKTIINGKITFDQLAFVFNKVSSEIETKEDLKIFAELLVKASLEGIDITTIAESLFQKIRRKK